MYTFVFKKPSFSLHQNSEKIVMNTESWGTILFHDSSNQLREPKIINKFDEINSNFSYHLIIVGLIYLIFRKSFSNICYFIDFIRNPVIALC